jgi:hypothetical protein
MLIVGGGFAAAAVGANALGLGVGSSPADWINAAAYGFGLGVVVFLVRFVDGETAAQQRSRPALIEERLARLEKAAGIEPDAERK